MSKLVFRYSSMNAGKSMNLISTWYNYNELGLNPLAILPDIIKENEIKSRTGLNLKAIKISELRRHLITDDIDCLVCDESHMFSKGEILLLSDISISGIPVICYGLRTDFRGELFEGSKYLLGIADELEELPTLCGCGKKARMNLRLVDGEIDKSNDSTLKLREESDVSYISMCRKHFYGCINGEIDIKDLNIFDNTSKIKGGQ